jgi:hypothetical protein
MGTHVIDETLSPFLRIEKIRLKEFLYGVRIWGILVCSYGNLALRPEKTKRVFHMVYRYGEPTVRTEKRELPLLWCTDMGRLGVQLWDVFLVCKSVVVYVHHLKYPAL